MKERHIIVAAACNGGIGYNGELLYRIPGDLKRFRELTTNNIVIMGRNTYESIGKALPNRNNIVITSRPFDTDKENLWVVSSLQEAFEMSEKISGDKVYIVGGGQIYREALPMVDVIDLTRIYTIPKNVDTYFDIDEFESRFITTEYTPMMYHDKIMYRFITLEKKK